jgi:hypothetical protein
MGPGLRPDDEEGEETIIIQSEKTTTAVSIR